MQKPTRALFKFSKAFHKYIGLAGLVYFFLMGISGVLLNHPSLIRSITVPSMLLPPSCKHTNWDRMAMREVAFWEGESKAVFIGGKTGVWQSRDGGRTFSGLTDGFPTSAYDRDTFYLLFEETAGFPFLYAGTRSGLYRYHFDRARWQTIGKKQLGRVKVVDLVQRKDQIIAFTENACFSFTGTEANPTLRPIELPLDSPENHRAPLTRWLLRLHDGTVFGIAGRLFVDVIGVVLIFLSISAFYIWYAPWKRKRFHRSKNSARWFRIFHIYHRKIGIYAAVFLVLISLTGIFIRPPLRQTIARVKVPSGWLGSVQPSFEKVEEISRAVYLPKDDTLLLATRKGFAKGPADFSKPFRPYPIKVPTSGMGLNVLENLAEKRLLIGSFKGIFIWDDHTNAAMDIQGHPVTKSRKQGMNGNRMVGAAVKKGELAYWADYRMGLQMVQSGKIVPIMPTTMGKDAGISLWHFMFLVHNGRIFQDWTGTYTWLIVFIGGLFFLVSVCTGCYDWVYRKGFFRVTNRLNISIQTTSNKDCLVKK